MWQIKVTENNCETTMAGETFEIKSGVGDFCQCLLYLAYVLLKCPLYNR